MNYIGDFDVGANVFIWYNTFSSNDPSASVTTTDFVDTDVHIYKDDSLTQRNNAAGVAVDVDVDTFAGVHKITIDTADNTVANFYEAGHDYAVVVVGTTVDAATINACVGTFSIANRRVAGQMCVSSIEGLTDQNTFTLTAGEASGDDDAYNNCLIIVTDQTTKIQKATGHISDYTGASRTVQLYASPLQTNFTMAVGDSVEIFATSAFVAGAVWDEVLTGSSHNISTSAGKRLRQIEEAFVHASGVIDTVTNGHTFTLDAGAVATADYYVGDRLQLVEGTGAGQSRLIVAYTAGKVVTLDSDFTTNPDTSTLYEINAADVHVSLSDADQAQGFVATYTNTTTITLDAAAVATTDYYLGSLIVFTHGTGAGQVREITGYTNGRVVTMSPALAAALDTTTVWHVQAAVPGADISTILATVNHADHGNAKLVRSTTPANKLDVSATGEAGLDFANIKDAAAHTTIDISVNVALATTLAVRTSDTIFTLNAGSGDNDAYNNMILALYDVSGTLWQTRQISDYVGASKTVTVDSAFTFTVAANDVVKVFLNAYAPTVAAGGGATAAEVWQLDVSGYTTAGQAGTYQKEPGGGRYG